MAERVGRVETPLRWQRALGRAMEANLSYIEIVGGDGAWAVSSRQDCERGYIATTRTCTCEAGRSGDPVCCHRALVRALTGAMALPDLPDDAPAAPVDCPACSGCGVQHFRSGNQEPCPDCGGTGRRVDLWPQGQPTTLPAAAA